MFKGEIKVGPAVSSGRRRGRGRAAAAALAKASASPPAATVHVTDFKADDKKSESFSASEISAFASTEKELKAPIGSVNVWTQKRAAQSPKSAASISTGAPFAAPTRKYRPPPAPKRGAADFGRPKASETVRRESQPAKRSAYRPPREPISAEPRTTSLRPPVKPVSRPLRPAVAATTATRAPPIRAEAGKDSGTGGYVAPHKRQGSKPSEMGVAFGPDDGVRQSGARRGREGPMYGGARDEYSRGSGTGFGARGDDRRPEGGRSGFGQSARPSAASTGSRGRDPRSGGAFDSESSRGRDATQRQKPERKPTRDVAPASKSAVGGGASAKQSEDARPADWRRKTALTKERDEMRRRTERSQRDYGRSRGHGSYTDRRREELLGKSPKRETGSGSSPRSTSPGFGSGKGRSPPPPAAGIPVSRVRAEHSPASSGRAVYRAPGTGKAMSPTVATLRMRRHRRVDAPTKALMRPVPLPSDAKKLEASRLSKILEAQRKTRTEHRLPSQVSLTQTIPSALLDTSLSDAEILSEAQKAASSSLDPTMSEYKPVLTHDMFESGADGQLSPTQMQALGLTPPASRTTGYAQDDGKTLDEVAHESTTGMYPAAYEHMYAPTHTPDSLATGTAPAAAAAMAHAPVSEVPPVPMDEEMRFQWTRLLQRLSEMRHGYVMAAQSQNVEDMQVFADEGTKCQAEMQSLIQAAQMAAAAAAAAASRPPPYGVPPPMGDWMHRDGYYARGGGGMRRGGFRGGGRGGHRGRRGRGGGPRFSGPPRSGGRRYNMGAAPMDAGMHHSSVSSRVDAAKGKRGPKPTVASGRPFENWEQFLTATESDPVFEYMGFKGMFAKKTLSAAESTATAVIVDSQHSGLQLVSKKLRTRCMAAPTFQRLALSGFMFSADAFSVVATTETCANLLRFRSPAVHSFSVEFPMRPFSDEWLSMLPWNRLCQNLKESSKLELLSICDKATATNKKQQLDAAFGVAHFEALASMSAALLFSRLSVPFLILNKCPFKVTPDSLRALAESNSALRSLKMHDDCVQWTEELLGALPPSLESLGIEMSTERPLAIDSLIAGVGHLKKLRKIQISNDAVSPSKVEVLDVFKLFSVCDRLDVDYSLVSAASQLRLEEPSRPKGCVLTVYGCHNSAFAASVTGVELRLADEKTCAKSVGWMPFRGFVARQRPARRRTRGRARKRGA